MTLHPAVPRKEAALTRRSQGAVSSSVRTLASPLRRRLLALVLFTAVAVPLSLSGTLAGAVVLAEASALLVTGLLALTGVLFRRSRLAPYFLALATGAFCTETLRSGLLAPRAVAVVGMFLLGSATLALSTPLALARRRALAAVAKVGTPAVSPRDPGPFRRVVESLAEVVIVLEGDLTIRYVSPAIAGLFGHDPTSLDGGHLEQLSGSHNQPLLEALRRAATVRGAAVRVEWQLIDGGGRRRIAESTVTGHLEDPGLQAYVLTVRDVTDRVLLEQQLRNAAFHDPLTGLANRALFLERAADSLRRCAARGQRVGVLAVNVDGFRALNDLLGRPAGDYMLNVVAHRLAEAVGPCHSVARNGADDFSVLLDGLEAEGELDALAEGIARRVRAAIGFNDAEHVLTVSIGGTLSGEGSTVETLLGEAAAALFSAKGSGGDAYRRFVPTMQVAAMARFDVEADLRRALERSEFELMYQPTFDVTTGRVASFEALLRWHRPGYGLVGPEEFVAIADESGLLVDIGRWTIRQALAELGALSELTDDEELGVGVNLSRNQLVDANLVEDVRVALAGSGIAPRRLILEISESILDEHSVDVLSQLKRLRALGVRLAIDDFGTGYATIAFLQRLPVDMLKIDRSFVQGCTDERGRGLLEAIVRLGQTLSVITVGEGAEEPRQLGVLCALGCDMVQGFLLSRPISAAEAALLIRRPEEHEASVSPFVGRWLQRHVVTETARALS